MEKVPLKELKENLSYWAEKASRGDTVEVTKHNKPYVRLVSSHSPGLYIGPNVGKPLPRRSPIKLKIPFRKVLEYLEEDRNEN